MLDAVTRREITFAVQSALHDSMSKYEEVWLSEKELLSQFQFLTKGFIKKYGHLLPRIQMSVMEKDGSVHRTGWAYPRNRMQNMIMNGKIEISMINGK